MKPTELHTHLNVKRATGNDETPAIARIQNTPSDSKIVQALRREIDQVELEGATENPRRIRFRSSSPRHRRQESNNDNDERFGWFHATYGDNAQRYRQPCK